MSPQEEQEWRNCVVNDFKYVNKKANLALALSYLIVVVETIRYIAEALR